MSQIILKNFIHDILYKAGYDNNFMNEITKNMKYFSSAFIHKSYNKSNNYEYLEINGDKIINVFIVEFTAKTFYGIKIDLLNKINNKLKGESTMVEIGKKLNLMHFIKYGEEIKNGIFLNNQLSVKFDKLNEDIFESLCGAFFFSCCDYVQRTNITNNFPKNNYQNLINAISLELLEPLFKYFYTIIDIDMNPNNYIDSNSELKELIDKVPNWKNYYNEIGGMISTSENNNKFTHTFYAFFGGDKTPKKQNLVEVASYTSEISKEDAKSNCNKIAIPKMKNFIEENKIF